MRPNFVLLLALIFGAALPGSIGAADTQAFVRDFYSAYKAKDAARIAQFYALDATFVDPSFELDLKGTDQIRALFTMVFPKYESLDWEISHTTTASDDLIVEGTMIGRIGRKTVRVPFVSVFHFRADKIATQRDLFDVLHFFVQLGAIPSPFGPKPVGASSPAPNAP
ncbi:MAG: SnoaL-like domain [Verrucomicrobiota bacterium]|jgi:uncharacterized protein (TIGR02246 family)